MTLSHIDLGTALWALRTSSYLRGNHVCLYDPTNRRSARTKYHNDLSSEVFEWIVCGCTPYQVSTAVWKLREWIDTDRYHSQCKSSFETSIKIALVLMLLISQCGGVVADTFDVIGRGPAMSAFTASVFLGMLQPFSPESRKKRWLFTLGPVIGMLASQRRLSRQTSNYCTHLLQARLLVGTWQKAI